MPAGDPGGHLADAGGTVSGGGIGSTGGGGSSGISQNFGSMYGGSSGMRIGGRPYGITPFAVPRRDQTLQDRQFGRFGGGMVGTSFGGSSGSGAATGTTPRRTPAIVNPVVRRPFVPVPQPRPPVPDWYGLPQYTPEDLPQDYYEHIPGINLPAPPHNYDWSGYDPYAGIEMGYTAQPGGPYGTGVGSVGGVISGTGSGSQQSGWGSFGGKDQSQVKDQGRLRYGGPAEEGRRYKVGENGPEDLVMTAGSGYVIPNPKDRNHPQAKRMAQRIFGAGRSPPPNRFDAMRGGEPRGGIRT